MRILSLLLLLSTSLLAHQPVNLYTGAYQHVSTDLVVNCYQPIAIVRTHDSQETDYGITDIWHIQDERISLDINIKRDDGTALLRLLDGTQILFKPLEHKKIEVNETEWAPVYPCGYKLIWNPDLYFFTLTFDSGEVRTYHAITESHRNRRRHKKHHIKVEFGLTERIFPNGNRHKYTNNREVVRRIVSTNADKTTTFGSVDFEYNDAMQTTAVISSDGHRIDYGYKEIPPKSLHRLTTVHIDGGLVEQLALNTPHIQHSSGIPRDRINANILQHTLDGRQRTITCDREHPYRVLSIEEEGIPLARYTYLRSETLITDALDQTHTFDLSYDDPPPLPRSKGAIARLKAWGMWHEEEEPEQPDEVPSPITYDHNGAPILVTYEDGRTIAFTRRDDGLATSVTLQAEGAQCKRIEYHYDHLNRITAQEIYDANNDYCYTLETDYDDLNQITRETDSDGNETHYLYDDNSNCTHVQTPDHTISCTYDPFHRLTSKTYDGYTCSYTYDPLGNLISETNAWGDTTTYSPDQELDQPTTNPLNLPDNCTLGDHTLSITDGRGYTTTITFDDQARPIALDEPGRYTTYTYDQNGNKASELCGDEEHHWTYDKQDHLTSYTYNSYTTAYAYNNAGQLTTTTKPSGIQHHREYDENDRLSRFFGPDFDYSFTYDDQGRILKAGNITRRYNDQGLLAKEFLPNGKCMSYTYDKFGRPIKINDTHYRYEGDHLVQVGDTTFTYDEQGYPITQNGLPYTYDEQGRLIEDPNQTYQYDPNGNLVNEYPYDPLNQLQAPLPEHTLTYDADGRIISDGICNYEYDSLDRLLTPGVIYDAFFRRYTSLHDTYIGLTQTTHRTIGNHKTLTINNQPIITDHLGNPHHPLYSLSGMPTENGIVYFPFRAYAPHLNKFLTPDPLQLPRPYTYCSNNPLSLIDPLGLYETPTDAFYPQTYSDIPCIPPGPSNPFADAPYTPIPISPSYPNQWDLNWEQYSPSAIAGTIPYAPVPQFKNPLAITFTGGMGNKFNDFIDHLQFFSSLSGNYPVQGVYNSCKDWRGTLNKVQRAKAGEMHTTAVHLQQLWDAFFDDNPTGHILHICHSAGAAETYNALVSYNPDLAKRITVIAIAPAKFIPPDLCESVVHLCRRKDLIARFSDPTGRQAYAHTIRYLPHSPGGSHLLDHSLQSPSYIQAIKDEFRGFIIKHAGAPL